MRKFQAVNGTMTFELSDFCQPDNLSHLSCCPLARGRGRVSDCQKHYHLFIKSSFPGQESPSCLIWGLPSESFQSGHCSNDFLSKWDRGQSLAIHSPLAYWSFLPEQFSYTSHWGTGKAVIHAREGRKPGQTSLCPIFKCALSILSLYIYHIHGRFNSPSFIPPLLWVLGTLTCCSCARHWESIDRGPNLGKDCSWLG